MPGALRLRGFQVPHAGQCPCGIGRWKGRREDETGAEASDEIADRGGGCDVAAPHPESLCQGALDDRQSMVQSIAFRNAAAARSVEADGVNFVEVGHCTVL